MGIDSNEKEHGGNAAGDAKRYTVVQTQGKMYVE